MRIHFVKLASIGAALMMGAGFMLQTGLAENLVYQSGERRDPFVPLVGPGGITAQESHSDLHIEGIIFDPPAGSLVLIKGEFYKQGDAVGNAQIISILQDRVIFQQNDEEKILWIREEIAEGEVKDATAAQ